jgi:hypothetical protein
VDVKTAQERLGHSDVRMTIGLYAQVEQQSDRAAADQLGKLFMARPSSDQGPTAPPSANEEPPSPSPEL